ncbi:MAG: hypothetical protein GY792_17560, partial [Gammaproteobacteria bacterium]|nr:hypothetical protein [Gammaproteobacteria bacterium]
TDTLTINGTAITGLGSDSSGAITGGHSYSYTQATGVVTITFAGSTNAAAAELVLESITYGIDASDQDPSTTARTVTLNTVTDNGGGADTNTDISETATISVGATDDAIDISTTGNTVTFTEDAGATTALFAAAIDTIETGDTISQVVLTLANIEAGDTLSFGATSIDLDTNGATSPDANGFTYTVSNAGAAPIITITHAGSDDATVSTMLNSAVFNNTTNNALSPTARTVTLTSVTDSGSGATADGTVATINVSAVNDAPSFDGGYVQADINNGSIEASVGNAVNLMAIQSDDKIVVAGTTGDDVYLTRYHADGSLDTSFGNGGIVITDFNGGGDDQVRAITIQDDGKILVAGNTTSGNSDYVLARYNTDGSLDTGFGVSGTGLVITDLGSSSHDFVRSLLVQTDGKIVVSGYSSVDGATSNLNSAVVRYLADGSLDTSFDGASNGNGIVIKDMGGFGVRDWIASSVQQDANTLLFAGQLDTNGRDFLLFRLNLSDGTLDTDFGSSGIVTTDFGGNYDQVSKLALQADGKILVLGYGAGGGGGHDLQLTRYDADGAIDASFGTAGKVTHDIGALDNARDMVIQDDGSILLSEINLDDSTTRLLRFDSNGNLDASFGSSGVVSDIAWNSGMALQSDGTIVLSGHVDNDLRLSAYSGNDGQRDAGFGDSTLDNTATFTEDGAAVILNADVDVSDVELDSLSGGLGNYDGASLTLVRNGGASAEDVFSETGTLSALTESGNVVVGGTIIGTVTTNSGGTLVLTFNTDATTARVNSALQQIAYSNSSDTPPASAQIDWSFDDGNTGSQGTGGALQATGSTTVTITAVNDTPTLAATPADDSLTENTDVTSAAVFPSVTIDPIETGDSISEAQVTLA